MSNQPDHENADPSDAKATAWAALQPLRHSLQAMATPWSPEVQRLLSQEQLLESLVAKPSSLRMQSPGQSRGLQQSVDALAFSENALLESAQAHAPMRTVPELNSKTVKPSKTTETQTPQRRNNRATQAPEEQRPGNSTPELTPLVNQPELTPSEFGEYFLKPEYMQRWIDEILAFDHIDSNRTLLSNNNDATRGETSDISGTAKTTCSQGSMHCAEQKNSANAKAQSKIRYLTEKRSKREKPFAHNEQKHPNPARTRDKVAGTEANNSNLKNTGEFIATNDPGSPAPEGFLLLRQLVKIKGDDLGSSPKHNAASKTTNHFEQQDIDHHQNPLCSNAAWQAMENALRRPTSVTHPNSNSQALNPQSGLLKADEHKSALNQDPEHIAALVNSALIDQAQRNGVDLS